MSKLKRLGYQMLDELVEKKGVDYIHDVLMAQLSQGIAPSVIAKEEFGIPYVVLKGWIELHCPEDVALAYRARADELEWEATEAVRNAEPETVSVAKLQSDHYMKLAGKLDRAKWGDKQEGVSAGGLNFTIVIGETHPAIPANVIEGEKSDG